jgi:MerR family transcriptional regulator, mercuric resistance operon regulatory protein
MPKTVTTSRACSLTIGALSKETGVNIETIRYYERVTPRHGPPAAAAFTLRHTCVYLRSYDGHVNWFSLDEIRTLIRLGGPERAPCHRVREIAAHHLEDIRAKISDLRKLERLLHATVARCTGTTAPECPVLDILDVRRVQA